MYQFHQLVPIHCIGFDEVPSPMTMIVTLEEQHTYMCNHSTTDRISWRVNDQVLGVKLRHHPGIEYTNILSHPSGAEVYTLTIRALPQNIETTIRCTAAFIGGSPQYSPTVTFVIQG